MQSQMVKQLAIWHEAIKDLAATDPRLASGAEKVLLGIREMQTTLVTPPQPTPISHRLIPQLEINSPMPAGAAVPARAPQSQPAPPQGVPARPAAAQAR